MFIQTEQTPNPATLKFLPGLTVLERGTLDITDRESAKRSPLATGLFDVDGVAGVFLGGEFIAGTKTDERDWATMKPMILGAIMEHYTSGAPVVDDADEVGEEAATGAIAPSTHPSTTYARDAEAGRGYTRDDNPTYDQAEALLAALEGGAGCLLFASGMAAAAAAFQTLAPGDHGDIGVLGIADELEE